MKMELKTGNEKKFEIEENLVHMLTNKKYGKERIIEGEALIHPLLSDKNFDSIPFEDYKWETKLFVQPFLLKKKKGEVFVIEGRVTHDSIAFQICRSEEKNKKAKELYEKYSTWNSKRFKETLDRVEKSGLFNKPLDHKIDI